jgi:hypothetical protein
MSQESRVRQVGVGTVGEIGGRGLLCSLRNSMPL